MIVTRDTFTNVLKKFADQGFYALDTETTGLRWWDNDNLFSIILTDSSGSFYFNFNDQPDHLGNLPDKNLILPRPWTASFQTVLENQDSTWFMHNAKFDMGMLSREGLCPTGTIHCTEAMARLIRSEFKSYSLDECMVRMARALGNQVPQKSDVVKKYVQKHKLYKDIYLPGKKKPVREVYYHKVPLEIMAEYGLKDGDATRALGMYQIRRFGDLIERHGDTQKVIDSERGTTLVTFHMEQNGLPLDRGYVEESIKNESETIRKLEAEYRSISGMDFVDSGPKHREAFEKLDIEAALTEKGNPSFDKEALRGIDHPLASVILDWRASSKRLGSYYSSFLYYQSSIDGAIHPGIFQSGTRTGRMSMRNPALQTIPKGEDSDLQWDADDDVVDPAAVRRCFIPPEGHCLFMPDYDQMEYRMMLDCAEEMGVIRKINDHGLDVHTATAEVMGVDRKSAKTINFMLLYGGGAQKLATALGISLHEARALKAQYFAALPRVKTWIYRIIKTAQSQGYIKNWNGRVCRIDKQFAYKAPNYYIQGGCADVAKKAAIQIYSEKAQVGVTQLKFLLNLQVHDELIMSIPKDELYFCPRIVEIMETTYPSKHLKLTVGPGYSWKSWGDKQDGYPQ